MDLQRVSSVRDSWALRLDASKGHNDSQLRLVHFCRFFVKVFELRFLPKANVFQCDKTVFKFKDTSQAA